MSDVTSGATPPGYRVGETDTRPLGYVEGAGTLEPALR